MNKTHLSIQRVAREIERNRKDILSLFGHRLKERMEVPENVRDDLTAAINLQIENLLKILNRYSNSEKAVDSFFQVQAKLSAGENGFTLELLISKYLLLKEVIFEILERNGPIDVKASNIIWQFIVHSIKLAVSKFESERQTVADQRDKQLNDSDTLNKSISTQILVSIENEERYRTLVEGVEDYAVFTTDTEGVITSWNPGAERMKGYTYSEAIGSHFSMLYPEEGRKKGEPMHHLHTALIEGRYRGEGIRQRKNKELFLADVYIRPIFKDGKHLGFAKVVSDVTERNKLMQAANVSNTLIVGLQSEKEQREKFVLTLSHDLRGPLSVARAAVELIGKHLDASHKSKKYVEKSLSSIDRVNRMISDLLDANRMIGGEKPHLNIQNWDLVRLTKNVCEDYTFMGAKVNLFTECKEIKGRWDGEGVRRVLENLITNAIKYGDNAFPVDVGILDLGKQVCLRIHNMGEVIKEDDQKSLFDQFRKTESSKEKNTGWGIGLSLVKGITEAHGGSIEVESYPIEGTTFTVNLPKNLIQEIQS